MVQVSFTQNLQRHVKAPTTSVDGTNVKQVLDAVFAEHPEVRDYVLDDQGGVRRHMVVFVDGEPIRDRVGLSDEVSPDAEVHVMQALSGG